MYIISGNDTPTGRNVVMEGWGPLAVSEDLYKYFKWFVPIMFDTLAVSWALSSLGVWRQLSSKVEVSGSRLRD